MQYLRPRLLPVTVLFVQEVLLIYQRQQLEETYSWTGPNGFTSSVQNPTIANATAVMAGTYNVTITTNGCTSAAGSTAPVVVNAIPSTPTPTSNSPVCAGSTINLSTSAVGGATYSWTGPNGFTSSVQSPTIANATAVMAGTYNVTITTNGCTSAAGSTAPVVVNAIPSTPTPTSNSPVCAGSTINLSTSAVGGATYSWTGPNGFTSSLQNPTIANATAAMAGIYNVTITTSSCTSAAGSTSIIVNPVLTPSVSIATSSTSICSSPRSSVTFTAAPTNGGTSPTYTFKNGAATLQTGTSNTYTTTSLPSGANITVAMTSNATCASPTTVTSSAISMNVYSGSPSDWNGSVNITASPSSICPPATNVTLSVPAVANAQYYQWNLPTGWTITSGNLTNNITATVSTTASIGAQIITVNAVNPCGSNNGITSPANGKKSIQVNTFNGVTVSPTSQSVCADGSITIVGTLTGASTSAAWSAPFGGFSNITQSGATVSATYTPSTPPAITNGNVTLTITTNIPGGNGCTNVPGTATVAVAVSQPSVAPTGISGTTTLCNSATTLTAVGGTLGTGANYQWGTGSVVGTNPIAGATSVSYTTPVLNSNTTYWVYITNTSGPCSAATAGVTQLVTVSQPSVAPTSISGTISLCNGSTTALTAVGGTLGTGANYQWGTGSVVGINPIAGATSVSYTTPVLNSNTTYWVYITNTSGPCLPTTTSGVTQLVTVNQPSVAPTSISGTTTLCNGGTTTLTAGGGTLGTGANYQWGMGSVVGTNPIAELHPFHILPLF